LIIGRKARISENPITEMNIAADEVSIDAAKKTIPAV
jgi:hypothetical protein